jgi:hypothetical protein
MIDTQKMTIPEIMESLNWENGSNFKMAQLKLFQDNKTLEQVLQMTYDKVKWTYGVSVKTITMPTLHFDNMTLETSFALLDQLNRREVTGNLAREKVQAVLEALTAEDAKIFYNIIRRDQRINMGRSNINKVFKNLITKPPYMRCGIYTTKTAKKINFPAYVQVKADGMFQAVTVDAGQVTFTARSGEVRELPHLETKFKNFRDGVYIGELLVHGLANRSESNGVINSDDSKEKVYIQLWDYVTLNEYSRGKDKKDKTIYFERYADLKNNVIEDENIKIIETHQVKNIQEALEFTSKWMNEGLEGAILKDQNNIFVDHTSPTQLKLKLEIDAEVRVTGFTEGKPGTKRIETFGAMTFENDEGTIKGRTSGFTDEQLEDFNSRRDELIGKVITVQFNDITKGQNNDFYALSHPRFIEFRNDKDTTDTLERVQESKEMAMTLGGK